MAESLVVLSAELKVAMKVGWKAESLVVLTVEAKVENSVVLMVAYLVEDLVGLLGKKRAGKRVAYSGKQ